MRAKPYFLINHEVKDLLVKEIIDLPVGQDYKVTISKSGTKSQRQQGLNWLWNSEVAASGIGQYDDKKDVHRDGKVKFAVSILLRDDDYFPCIYSRYKEVSNGSKDDYKKFLDDWVKTQDFTVSQAAEYLTEFQRYWLQAGVNLTNPDLYGISI